MEWGPSRAFVKLVRPLFHVIYKNTRTWDYRLSSRKVGNNKLLSESSWEFPPVKIYLAVNLLTCDTYLIWWKRLIKTIFRPIWRISSIFFNNEKKASKVWLAEESDDTLFRFPRHQKFPPWCQHEGPWKNFLGASCECYRQYGLIRNVKFMAEWYHLDSSWPQIGGSWQISGLLMR